MALANSARLSGHKMASGVTAALGTPERTVWLFGYGSLISESSRKKTSTAVTGDSFPGIVQGLSRGWFTPVQLPKKAQINSNIVAVQAVGVTEAVDAACSGIIFGVKASALAEFDKREANYERVKIDWTRVQPFGDSGSAQKERAESLDEDCYCYVQKATSAPSPAFPVIQSYVDVILDGCMETSPQFVREFIKTTSAWPKHDDGSYLDDRTAPGYVRYSDDASAKAEVWDSLLEEGIPGILAVRQRQLGSV